MIQARRDLRIAASSGGSGVKGVLVDADQVSLKRFQRALLAVVPDACLRMRERLVWSRESGSDVRQPAPSGDAWSGAVRAPLFCEDAPRMKRRWATLYVRGTRLHDVVSPAALQQSHRAVQPKVSAWQAKFALRM
jgi:hypothetical protein